MTENSKNRNRTISDDIAAFAKEFNYYKSKSNQYEANRNLLLRLVDMIDNFLNAYASDNSVEIVRLYLDLKYGLAEGRNYFSDLRSEKEDEERANPERVEQGQKEEERRGVSKPGSTVPVERSEREQTAGAAIAERLPEWRAAPNRPSNESQENGYGQGGMGHPSSGSEG